MNTILLSQLNNAGELSLTLNRPQKRNAFDAELIDTLMLAFHQAKQDTQVRVVILSGTNSIFSSGADLAWMQSMVHFDYERNREDAMQLARLMRTLYELDKPTIAKVNGHAFGGAVGLVACCDIAVAAEQVLFSFSEVRLGLIPAVISPYIIHAIGARQAKKLFLTGERFNTQQALQYGLIHESVAPEALDGCVQSYCQQLVQGGPHALQEVKALVHAINPIDLTHDEFTAQRIAAIRVAEEGQAGLNAFLSKRKPPWIKEPENETDEA